MSSITNVNNNASVVNVGRTTPVSPGVQPAAKSIPVVVASDQVAIPVEEQNKVQSEVALSLLGIPRAEVALGIFADVNTYDVNPTEWSSSPQYHITGYGIKHLPNEAGALVEAPRNKTSVLTSKRFFRYQPGRVSAATFGVKSTTSVADYSQNPSIRKFGIYDNFDGYFWETRNDSQEDNFCVVRRSQSMIKAPASPTGLVGQPLKGGNPISTISLTQNDDFRIIGQGQKETVEESTLLVKDRKTITDNRFAIVNTALAAASAAYAVSAGTSVTVSSQHSNGTVVNGVIITSGSYTSSTGTAAERFYKDLALAINTVTGNTNFSDGTTSATPDITAAQVEIKCKRDLDYWIDNYLLDMEYGGTAHTNINISNYATGLFPQIATFEKAIHAQLKIVLDGYAGITSAGDTKITALTAITQTAFNRNNGSGVLVPSVPTTSEYGTRNKLETVMTVKGHYWSYVVSASTATNKAIIYATPTAAQLAARGLDPITATDIKYKCQRDVGYIIDGYSNDISGGGDAETKYNMTMYFKGGREGQNTGNGTDGFGMSIYSQTNASGVLAEIERHTHLRDKIKTDLVAYGFGTTTAEYKKLVILADRVISNFTTENQQSMELGDKGFAGNLVALRDGLIVTHAAVFDATLLKTAEKIVTVAIGSDAGANLGTPNSFKISKGHVTFGQHIKLYFANSEATRGTLVSGTVYQVVKVYGPKGNEFTLQDEAGIAQTLTVAQATAAGAMYVETVVPFIFPKAYQPSAAGYWNKFQPAVTLNDASDIKFPRGMVFPYMYADDQNLGTDDASSLKVGYINSALDLSLDVRGLSLICDQIDSVNFIPEYINWIKNNVKPEFYGVYDYRVPRSRFSHDTLDGKNTTAGTAGLREYSDLATGENGIARPGQRYTTGTSPNLVPQYTDSLYNFDFTKVTMLKIEFSWYGAVGALFLAYVPVANGEARWVRVHHLRASNQLKIASLGNATLPITYTTYGGGDAKSLGDGEDVNFTDRGYGADAHSIVKYGASYYIDGGDRGTVRLYSHNNEDTASAYGKQWSIANGSVSSGNKIAINSTSLATGNPSDSNALWTSANGGSGTVDTRFFMGARVKTSNRTDQNINVVWADSTHIYLSSSPSSTTGIKLLVDRANSTFGLETKKVILSTRESNAVRNRVQVYPTKLSTANLSTGSGGNPIRLRFKKTPLFQTAVEYTSTLTLSAEYTITAANLPLAVTEGGGAGTFMDNAESLYGWFQARVAVDDVTVFGRLYKDADSYYFEILESFNAEVVLKAGLFLPDLRFEADGDIIAQNVVTKSTSEKEGLSSVKIADNTVVPIPGTGINVATIYLQQGTEQLDLSPYFDYNKEYLSFPLTDQADSLYFTVDSDTPAGDAADQVSIGCTWEEQ